MPKQSGFKWNGLQVNLAVEKHNAKNLRDAGSLLLKETKRVISTSGRTVSIKLTKTGKVRKKLGKAGSDPSQPGDPPRKQTGELRRSIFKKMRKKGVMRVGSTAGHAPLQEFGTRNQAARPFLRPTLYKLLGPIRSILTRKIPGKS